MCDSTVREYLSKAGPGTLQKEGTHATIFDDLTRKDNGNTLEFEVLRDEAFNQLNAAVDTTSCVLHFALYYFLTMPDVQQQILKELFAQRKINDRYTLTDLERLPYLVCTSIISLVVHA